MTTRNDESIQYNVLVVNFHFDNFNIFLKGTWNGKLDSPPIIQGWDDTEIPYLVSPPLILDNIEPMYEIEIRDYANDCRHLFNAAKARNGIPIGDKNRYSIEVNEVIKKYHMDTQPYQDKVYEAITIDVGVKIAIVNKITLERKIPKKEYEGMATVAMVTEICEKFTQYIDKVTDEIIELDPYNLSLGKMQELANKLKEVPITMRLTQEQLENSMSIAVNSQQDSDDRQIMETTKFKVVTLQGKSGTDRIQINDEDEKSETDKGEDTKPPPKTRDVPYHASDDDSASTEQETGKEPFLVTKKPHDLSISGTDHEDQEMTQVETTGHFDIETSIREVPSIVPLAIAARPYASHPSIDTQREHMASLPQPEIIEGLETTIPDFRPTNEDQVLKILSDKIKGSPFGQLKHVRTLKEPIEVILAYATFLFAMIGQKTVSNVTIDKKSRSDWFHINEKYRKNYIMAFYAAFRNYGNTVHKGNPYRKENTENGMIAAMTLMISTAIGASDDTFLKALDEENWKKSIYPFISGRRKIVKAEAGTKAIIDEGRFQVDSDGRGRIHSSVIDYFDHAYPLRSIRKDKPKINVARFENEREESDEEPPVKTIDYFATAEQKRRESISIVDIDAPPTGRALRKRKDPPSSQPSTPRPKKKTTPTVKPKYSSTSPLAKKKKIIETKKAKTGTKKTSGKRISKTPYIDDDSDTTFEEESRTRHDTSPTSEPRAILDREERTIDETAQITMEDETVRITTVGPIGPSGAVDIIVANAARGAEVAKALEAEKLKLTNKPVMASGPKRTAKKMVLPTDTIKATKESGESSDEIENPKESEDPQETIEDPKEPDQEIGSTEDNPEEQLEAV